MCTLAALFSWLAPQTQGPLPPRPIASLSLSLSGCCKRDRRRYIKCLLPLREAKSDDWRASGPKADMGSEVIMLGWAIWGIFF